MAFPGSQRVLELFLFIDIDHNAAEMAGHPGCPYHAAADANPVTAPMRRRPEGRSKPPPISVTCATLPLGALTFPGFEQRKNSS